MGFSNDYRIRYSECDQQGVVFNSWYVMFMDDAVDVWLRELDRDFESRGWEVMVKRSEIVWHDSARHNEVLTLACEVSRWGNTSLDVSISGSVGERHCFDGKMVYVVVDTSERSPVPIPDDLRSHLSS
jgi:acyl-CoA thioester hydrolase